MSGSITECYCVFRGLLRPLPFLIPLLIIGFLIASPPSAMAQDADGDGVPDVSDNCVNNANANQENTNASTTDGDKCDGTTFNPSLEASSGAFHASTPLYRTRIDTTTGCIKFAANAGIGSTPDEDIGVNPVKGKRHKDDGRGKKRDRDDEDDGRDKRHGRDDDDDDDERDKRYGKRDDEGRGH